MLEKLRKLYIYIRPSLPNNTIFSVNIYRGFTAFTTDYQEDILNYLATKRKVIIKISVSNE